jgi:Flp pilus assembly protein TadG
MNLLRNEDGQATMFVALFFGLLFLGLAALAIDVGMLYREKRMVQTAADAAAIAAAAQYPGVAITTSAPIAAKQQPGIVATGTHAAIITPTLVGTGTSDVLVTVTQPTKTFFMGAFRSAFQWFNVSASAEASVAVPLGCVFANTNIVLTGGGTFLDATYCTTETDGSVTASGSAALNACAVRAVGTISSNNGGSIENSPPSGCSGSEAPNSAPMGDPLSGKIPSATSSTGYNPSQCVNNYGPSGGRVTYQLGPGAASCPQYSGCGTPAATQNLTVSGQSVSAVCYSGGLSVANGNHATLEPGLYIINGGTLNFGGGDFVSAAGVSFYLTNGATLNFANNFTGVFSAPTSGPYSGILFYQDPSDTNAATFGGGASGGFVGSIDFPGANLTFNNNVHVTVNGFIDTGGKLELDGSAEVTDNYNPATTSGAAGTVRLVQ